MGDLKFALKFRTALIIIFSILIAGCAGLSGFFLYKKKKGGKVDDG